MQILRESTWDGEGRVESHSCKPRSAQDGQPPTRGEEDARKGSPLQVSEGARLCPHLDFRRLSPRTVSQ